MDVLVENYIPSQWTTSSNLAATLTFKCAGHTWLFLIDNNGALRHSRRIWLSESGAHGGLVQPYCLLLAGLYCAPAVISVRLCDVNVMEGKTFNTTALVGCLAAMGGSSSSDWPQGHMCWWTRQMMTAAQVACDLGLHYWSVHPREAGMEEGPKKEGRDPPQLCTCQFSTQGIALT